MKEELNLTSRLNPLYRCCLTFFLVWTIGIGVSYFWNYKNTQAQVHKLAYAEATMSLSKDMAYRKWASLKGGLYVPISHETPPSPYLAHLKNRDLTSTSGMKLTLINPSYMTRQTLELGNDKDAHGHLTSLTPLRPDNAPDLWERAALVKFASGTAEEVSSIEKQAGQRQFRLMRPHIADNSCIKCHNNYTPGQISGGISVSIPLSSYENLVAPNLASLGLVHLGLWVFGIVGIVSFNRANRSRIIAQKEAEESLHQSLQEKDTLLRELHHRTKNNMHVISNLLFLQSSKIKDPKITSMFEDTRDRIRSMALIHDKLYRSRNFTQIDLADYVEDVVNVLLVSHNMNDRGLKIIKNVDPLPLSLDTLLPLGLILNELVTNSLKHAFSQATGGEIRISIQHSGEATIRLKYSDSGSPLPPDLLTHSSKTLGMELIKNLAESQLRGRLTIDPASKTFTVEFAENIQQISL